LRQNKILPFIFKIRILNPNSTRNVCQTSVRNRLEPNPNLARKARPDLIWMSPLAWTLQPLLLCLLILFLF